MNATLVFITHSYFPNAFSFKNCIQLSSLISPFRTDILFPSNSSYGHSLMALEYGSRFVYAILRRCLFWCVYFFIFFLVGGCPFLGWQLILFLTPPSHFNTKHCFLLTLLLHRCFGVLTRPSSFLPYVHTNTLINFPYKIAGVLFLSLSSQIHCL